MTKIRKESIYGKSSKHFVVVYKIKQKNLKNDQFIFKNKNKKIIQKGSIRSVKLWSLEKKLDF